jgi:hypothetical protein
MRLAALSQALRETSDRFGGISHYLEAAGDLDRACSEFFKDQDFESLARLTGAVARADRFRKEVAVAKGPKAV